MFCVTIKVNDVGEKTDYTFGDIEVGMSIYMDDTSVAGGPEEVKKGIRKCTKMEVGKKMQYSLSKTQYMIVKTGKEKEKYILEQLKAGNIQRTKKY